MSRARLAEELRDQTGHLVFEMLGCHVMQQLGDGFGYVYVQPLLGDYENTNQTSSFG